MSDIPYTAPVRDMLHTLEEVVGLEELAGLPGFEEATPDMVASVLEEAARLASGVLAPLNAVGDKAHCKWTEDGVTTPPGFKDAYGTYCEGGWNGLPFSPDFGGMGLPWVVAMAVQEMLHSANMAFGLCPMLNQGAVELLEAHGTEEQKALYLPKLISGEWAGTMNLTEPAAGSDLSVVRCKAVADPSLGEGAYRVTGQKIFITFGEHDLTENIIHMVLARTPDAPAGTKGLGLFIVPKYLVDADGNVGELNDVKCASIEHKMGINGSPTCTMAFGDEGEGAVGYVVGGNPQAGIKMMFTMMNNARLSVGLEGVAIGERAYGQAVAYAKDRVQSKAIDAPKGESVAIVEHPDVRRMLLTMRAMNEAGRALVYTAGAALDRAKRSPDADARAKAQRLVDLLTPIAKAWCTDNGVIVASEGVQVHGGMGYVEETGAAQHLRDARIAPIYEGTNGIQAADLAFRKVARDGGEAAQELIAEMRAFASADGAASLAGVRARLLTATEQLEQATTWVVKHGREAPATAAAGARTFLEMWGVTAGGYYLAKSAEAAAKKAGEGDADGFYAAKQLTARFFSDHFLTRVPGMVPAVTEGHAATLDFVF